MWLRRYFCCSSLSTSGPIIEYFNFYMHTLLLLCNFNDLLLLRTHHLKFTLDEIKTLILLWLIICSKLCCVVFLDMYNFNIFCSLSGTSFTCYWHDQNTCIICYPLKNNCLQDIFELQPFKWNFCFQSLIHLLSVPWTYV